MVNLFLLGVNMNELIQTFNFGVNEVRTAIKDGGDVYFCLTDVADVLAISRSSDLLQVQKDFVKNETPKNRGTLDPKGVEKIPTPTNGGVQQLIYVNEPNLYRVIFRSNKVEARQFQDWVFNEVLPTIRRTGSYSTELTTKDSLLLGIFKAEGDVNKALAINAYEEQYVRPLENRVVEQEEQITILQPKGKFYDAVIQSETLLDLSEVSKLLNYKGLGRNNLFRHLRENGILNNKNLPYQTYVDRGYFKIVESSWVNPSTKLVEVSLKTVMFQKGIDWLDKLLSEHFDKNTD